MSKNAFKKIQWLWHVEKIRWCSWVDLCREFNILCEGSWVDSFSVGLMPLYYVRKLPFNIPSYSLHLFDQNKSLISRV
jgi:hypothetical protein